jgi:hypothetical protein
MIIRALDENSDFSFGKGKQSYAFGQNAIAQNIQTRLISFFKDCWFDTEAGIDWYRLHGSLNTKQEIELRVRAMILQSYGVVKVNSISVVYSGTTRNSLLQYSVVTIYSQNVVNTVGI